MYGRALALGFGLLLASSSYAEVAVVNVSFNVQEGPGPYDQAVTPTLTIDVLLSRVSTGDLLPVRMLQFDTTQTDSALVLGLPITHDIDLVSDRIHFWWFLRDSGGICTDVSESDCGQKYYIEDVLAGTRPNVISIAYLGLGENFLEELTIPGDPAQQVKVGEITVDLPVDDGTYLLDLMNATLDDPDAGGAELHVSHTLPLTPFRAFETRGLGGGTLDIVVLACAQAASISLTALNLSQYPCESTLPRIGNNRLRFEFDIDVTVPAPGEIVINKITGPGAYGPDISGSFTFSIDPINGNPGNVLLITENGVVFEEHSWYAVRNIGGWCEAGNFEVNYGIEYGDVDGFGGTGFNDLQAVFNVIPPLAPPANALSDSARADVDTLGGVGFNDLQAVFNNIPGPGDPVLGPNPNASGCSP